MPRTGGLQNNPPKYGIAGIVDRLVDGTKLSAAGLREGASPTVESQTKK